MHQIAEARIADKSVWEHVGKELVRKVDEAIIRISAICGAVLPQTDFFSDVLNKQFRDYLLGFGYSEYSFKEIVLAFMLNAQGGNKFPSGLEVEQIEFKGGHFNIDYAAKVLYNYSQFRDLTDRKFQNFIDGYE